MNSSRQQMTPPASSRTMALRMAAGWENGDGAFDLLVRPALAVVRT